MGGKRLRFFNFWEFLRLCWLFSWWTSIGATLVATYILGNCWRCFLENGTYVRQEQQIGETYTTKWDTESGYPTRLYIKEARQCNDTRPPLDRIKLIQGNHLQQRRIYAFYIEFCGDPTRWHIEERQCSCSFLYGWETAYRICGSVTFRGCIDYMKTLVTLHLLNLYGWETA